MGDRLQFDLHNPWKGRMAAPSKPIARKGVRAPRRPDARPITLPLHRALARQESQSFRDRQQRAWDRRQADTATNGEQA